MILLLAASLAACAPAAPRPATSTASAHLPPGGADPCDLEAGGRLGRPECPNTGDGLPDPPVTNPACADAAPGATRWLADRPHTPLAIGDRERGLFSAGQACCAPWARLGATYRAIDAWGQVVGAVRVDGGEGYDVTRCFELSLETLSGQQGAGLFASAEGSWTPPASAEWRPSPEERASFARFLAAVEQVTLTDPAQVPRAAEEAPLAPLEERTLYFQLADEDEGEPTTHRCAVAGGRLLVIAWLSPGGRWVAAHLEWDLSNLGYGPLLAYRPLAAFDMDGDGRPEVAFEWDEGPSWGQRVLRADQPVGPWETAAESIGGATL